jgi:thioredoxin-related protein
MRKIIYILLLISCFALAQKPVKLQWHKISEIETLMQKEQRKVMIDFYTDWCGWCKKMDAETFAHPVIAEILNKHIYLVKFDAESFDTVVFKNQKYFKNDQNKRTPHNFAAFMLNGKMSYPTTVFLDEQLNSLGPIPGFFDAATMEKILMYFVEDHYKSTEWKVFQKNYAGKIKVEEHGY